jgi:hypothetical protein
MAFDDMLSRFQILHRTRLFDREWNVVQKWTTLAVPWVPAFHTTRFVIQVKTAGTVVFVLSQVK